MRIDAHQHYWHYNAADNNNDYPWIDDSKRILQQDYLPSHLEPAFIENGFHGGVAVQARHSSAETDYLLDLKAKSRFILGVVGWVDLCAENIADTLATYDGKVAGFRHQLEDETAEFMLTNEFRRGISKLERFNFTYDLLVTEEQLSHCTKLVTEFPDQRFVLDHLGKPDFTAEGLAQWSKDIEQLATHPNVFCKLSGMVTERMPLDEDELNIDAYVPYLDTALEAFTPARLMYGSDWPVCSLAATYDEVYDILTLYLDRLTIAERDQIMGNTAAEFYQLTT